MNHTMQPTTVFINVNKHAVTRQVRILRKPYDQEDFRSFLHSSLDYAPERKELNEYRAFAYEFPDAEAIPSLEPHTDKYDYFFFISSLADKQGIKPRSEVLLRDASYCREYGIDLFSEQGQHEALIKAPGYQKLCNNLGFFIKETDGVPTCRAVDIGDGVLLYDMSLVPGQYAYRSLLQHCADHFYDPGFGIERLNLYDLNPLSLDDKVLIQHIGSLNFNFNHHSKNFGINQLRVLPLLGKEVLADELPLKEYEMSPSSDCFYRFILGEHIRVAPQSRPFDISILDMLARYGYPEPEEIDWKNLSSYMNRFNDLEDKIHKSEDPSYQAVVQEQVRERALGLLERDFSDRRRDTREPAQELSPYMEIPSQISKGPKI